jgi:hypothetical protein
MNIVISLNYIERLTKIHPNDEMNGMTALSRDIDKLFDDIYTQRKNSLIHFKTIT